MRYVRAIRNTIVGWAASKEFALRREGKTGLAKILRWIK